MAAGDQTERAFWARVIEKGDQRDGDLEHALELLNAHGALEQTRTDALAWAGKAKDALAVMPRSDMRDMLADLADYVVARVN